MYFRFLFRHILILLLLAATGYQLTAQTVDQKTWNRLQYHKYKWQVFHGVDMHLYFPRGYDSLAAFVSGRYKETSSRIQKRMGEQELHTSNIVIYPSTDQLYESNIGSFEPASYTLPTVVLKGNRMLLCFNGSYQDLQADLQEAIARSAWEESFKSDPGTQLKGTVADQRIPYWFKEGAIRYFSRDWSIGDEDALRRIFQERAPGSWNDLIGLSPKLAGQGFCYFLSEGYYRQAVMNLYGQVRKKKSLPRAVRLIVKKNLDSVMSQCFYFYSNRFAGAEPDLKLASDTLVIPHKKGRLRSVTGSRDSKAIAYVSATWKKRTVWVYDRKSESTHKLYAYNLPPWIEDSSPDPYPLLAWDEQDQLTITVPEKGKLRLYKYSIAGSRLQDNSLYGVDGISSLKPLGRNDHLMAAFRRGQSDIVVYNDRKEKYTALTEDAFDDGVPDSDAPGGNTAFVSTRPVPAGKDRNGKDSFRLEQGIFMVKQKQVSGLITDTASWIISDRPQWLADDRLLFADTRTGAARFALWQHGRITQYGFYSPFDLSAGNGTISFFKDREDSILLHSYPLEDWLHATETDGGEISPWLADYRKNAAERAKEDSILKAARSQEPSFLDGVFHPKGQDGANAKDLDSAGRIEKFDPHKTRPYVLQLHSAYFTARVNNDYFINRYQPYLNYQGQFKFPEAGGMASGGFTDLFENHHFSIAYRLPAGSEGSDFFISYGNTARKTDWSLLWFRKVESLKPDPQRNWLDEKGNPYPNAANVKTNYYSGSLHHPVSYYTGIDLSMAIRNDRTVFLATEKYSLTYPDLESTWWITTLSGSRNRLQPTLPFLYKGFRTKVTADLFKGLSQEKEMVYAAGFDLEYHQPFYRYITAVVRVQAGLSGGEQKILYNLGGVDNNLRVQTDTGVHFAQQAPYAFQKLVTPFRGYRQNMLYGDQFGLLNLDVYFPLFQSLIPIETPLESVNNLQLGMFSDLATANESWNTGKKAGASLGLSARTSLAGYPLRLDMAWPLSGGKPVWYISLSL